MINTVLWWERTSARGQNDNDRVQQQTGIVALSWCGLFLSRIQLRLVIQLLSVVESACLQVSHTVHETACKSNEPEEQWKLQRTPAQLDTYIYLCTNICAMT